ncbi:PepSY domain-containing protein [Pigmentiphaga litoralis]|uniref:Putative membrane protein YkoI n=1 Tax=Pigmentiphaga litoralis TaxID=516702 RepID=A0A7Y9LMI7_9BURK|nr:PepSY domain-containing protein [Pigmentiphaga litoralis]NYE24096.1 putative membrane protein YkoI [Pigmentiphaga litoralis]NYE82290.1 putative membrane protein YkoI [Pigmentiphaga litoralis]
MSCRPALSIPLLALLLVVLLAVCAPPAGARDNDDDKRHDHSHDKDRDRERDRSRDRDRDQDRARNAMLQGEIRPLAAVLKTVRDKVPGEIIEIELDREDKGWVYEVKVLTSNGRRKKVDVDAHSLDILKID